MDITTFITSVVTALTVLFGGAAEPTDVATGNDIAITVTIPEKPFAEIAQQARDLETKGRAPKTGYERDLFGKGWKDTDANGCDARNDILARDLSEAKVKTGGCVVLSGVLNDPYTGKTINFERGQDTSRLVQIDHVVALSDAWQKGAQSWDETKRVAFANDPLNLLAVDGQSNSQKRDSDAATWLPANKEYRCTYVAKQVVVKRSYGLWVTPAEKDTMISILDNC